MTVFEYDNTFVIGSIIIATLTCYAVIAIEQLLFKTFKTNYKTALVLSAGAILGTAIWGILGFVILIGSVATTSSYNLSLGFLSYVMALAISSCAIWMVRHRELPLALLLIAAIALSIGYWGSYELAIKALLPLENNQFPSLKWRVIAISLASLGIASVLWIVFRSRDSENVLWVRFGISCILGCSLIALQSIYMPHFQNVLQQHVVGLYSTHVIFGAMFVFGSFVVAIIALLHWFEWCLTDREKSLYKANKTLTSLMQHDNLTLLPNRVYLNNYVKSMFAEHRLHKQSAALIGINLDRFKAVNDAFGYHVGDELLLMFARRISSVLGENQTLFRVGSDEFLCVAEHCSVQQAEQLAQTILDSVNKVFVIAGRNINITASLGIAVYPEHGKSLQELLMHSDIAMLEAKSEGRNTFHVFNFNLGQYEERHQSKLINDLFKALEDDQFILFYQPKFTSARKICGVEALIRWQHPKLGLLGPGMFIPLAETTGLMIPLGYWVMEQACKQIQAWEAQNITFYPISINLSAVQVEHKALIHRLRYFIQQYDIDPNHLIIEITESTAMHNIEFSIEIFQQIRELGIRLSIDDFGTGHSSFVYLKDLPVNELKIDRAFIRNLTQGSKDELVLESLIQLTRNLGLTVTAEGVETESQFDILKGLGCQQFQGFLLGKPMPKEVLELQMKDKLVK